jgi:hypothetical protein
MGQNKELSFIQYLIITFAASVSSQSNCMLISAWNRYGSKPDNGVCLEVSTSDLSQMIIHTQISIIGFTFNFKNGSSQSCNENSGVMNNFVINFNNIYMTGGHIYVGEGIEALKLQLYDPMTQKFNSTDIIGYSQNDCFSYFNSSFFKSQSLIIDSIKGCVDIKRLNYLPFLEFKYSFSQCPIQELYPKNPATSTSTTTLSTSTNSTSTTTSSSATSSISTTTTLPISTSSALTTTTTSSTTSHSTTTTSSSTTSSTSTISTTTTLSTSTSSTTKTTSIHLIDFVAFY